ncbi:MAG: DMT family transporter [Acidimicrobiia bacterium]|nr:DMT family transporter [Acidimicrobiia bacterium]
MIGILLGLSSAICFAIGAVFFKFGQRTRQVDNGLFVSIVLNVALLGAIAAITTWPRWNAAGFIAFVIGGVIGTVGGRASNLKAIRQIGPSRANAFLTANPVVAAIAGWFVLRETLGLQEFVGGSMVILGLLLLIRSRSVAATASGHPTPMAGYLWAIAAPTCFGLAFVVRKWGLARYPGPVIGAFIGVAAALLLVSALEARTGRLSTTVRSNIKTVSWWYVGAGVFTSLALLAQFAAFTYLPAWVVGILQGTQGMWTLILAWIFLRREERIDRALVGTVLLVMVGVTLIGLEV